MSVTIDQLNAQASLISQLRSEKAEAARINKEISERLEQAENQMIELLESAYPDEPNPKFHSADGLVYISNRTSVKLPQGEDRAVFYAYLEKLGLKEAMLSVNSNTLNKFYKDQFELAKARGDTDFEIPGLKDVTITRTLGMRKQ